jgi:hypothetical protein
LVERALEVYGSDRPDGLPHDLASSWHDAEAPR